tara:strand:- start:506 stop:2542 length:2037 start_codon:yes stop_codon:yes gene_type:complete
MSDTKKFKIVVDSKGAEKGLKKTSKGLKDVGKSSKISAKGFKMMGTALKAMGIGLIIAVVAKLTEMLMKNQKISDLVARVMDTLGQVINVLVDILFIALKAIDKLTFGMLNLSGEADGATKSLQKQRNEYELLEAGMEKIKLQYETQIEKLRQIRDNEHLTMEERIAASDAIAKTLDQQYATERARILEMIQVKKNLLKADRHNIELKKELLAVETMLAELDNRITSQRSEQIQSFNSLKSSQVKLSTSSSKAIKEEVKSIESMILALDKYGGKIVLSEEEKHKQTLTNMEKEFWDNILAIRENQSKADKKKQRTEFDKDLKNNKKILNKQKESLEEWYRYLKNARNEEDQATARENIKKYKQTIAAQEEVVRILRESRETQIRNNGAYSEDEIKLIEAYNKKKEQIQKDHDAKVKATAEKEQQRINDINSSALQIANEDLQSAKSKELQAIQDKYKKILAQEELGEIERFEIQERWKRDKEALDTKYNNIEKAKEKEQRDFFIDGAVQLAQSLTQISAARANNEITNLEKQFKKGEISEKQFNKRRNQIEKEQAKKEKAAALLQIGVDTARGISAAVQAGAGIPFPGNLAAIATGVLAVVGGIAQASAILGQTPEGIDTDTEEAGFDDELEGGQAQVPSVTFGAAGADAPPIQAFVVESDVSGSQALAEDLELQATL